MKATTIQPSLAAELRRQLDVILDRASDEIILFVAAPIEAAYRVTTVGRKRKTTKKGRAVRRRQKATAGKDGAA